MIEVTFNERLIESLEIDTVLKLNALGGLRSIFETSIDHERRLGHSRFLFRRVTATWEFTLRQRDSDKINPLVSKKVYGI